MSNTDLTSSEEKARERKLLMVFVLIMITSGFFALLFSFHVFESWQMALSDNLFTEKRPLENIVIIAIDDRSLQEIGRWPWPREVYLDMFDLIVGSRVIGFDVAMFESYDKKIDSELGELFRSKGNVVIPIEYSEFKVSNGGFAGSQLLTPVEELSGVDAGLVNVYTDEDGITRRMPLNVGEEKSFGLVITEKVIGSVKYPGDRLRINFVGKPGSFSQYSFSEVIKSRGKYDFTDKIVLIGATAPDLHDDSFVPTSAGKAMPGVEIHANFIQTLITKDFLHDEPRSLVIISIFVLAFIVGGSVAFLRLRWASLLSVFIFVANIFAAISLFTRGIVLNIVYPSLAIIFSYTVIVSYSYVFERREKRKALKAFKQYVSPDVIEEIMHHPEKLKLGGDKREITVFFSDIRGFTSFSEKLKPEELVSFLNEYLSDMSAVILQKEGLIDKYIGDAIMAFWGAPLDNKNHAEDACIAALLSIKKLKEIQDQFKERDLPHIDIGIGLNSGDAVVGNMGSHKRFDYTAMGDTINLGSRLEGLTKQYGVKIIVSANTYEHIRDKFTCRELDLVQVKGKKKAIHIYELVSIRRESCTEDKEFISLFHTGLRLYRHQEWDRAISIFKECLEMRNDLASQLYIGRCQVYKNNPPGNDWNGVWEWKSK